MNKLLLSLLFVSVAVSSLLIGNGVTQSFQTLYAKTLQFENNGVGVILTPGIRSAAGPNTLTIPDMTGTIATSSSTAIASTNVVCWKSTGSLGKCTTSITGVNCGSCT